MAASENQTGKPRPRPFSIPGANGNKVRCGYIMKIVKCSQCGKKFERPFADWGYQYNGKDQCTYKCMRAAEREGEQKL